MTKLRDPLSFSLAITTAVGLIGWEAAARLTGRARRTVRHWSESDRKGTPTLDQAMAIDRAFLEKGGAYPPILQSYARQLNLVMLPMDACTAELAADIAAMSRETAEAIADALMVMQAGASPAVVDHAIAELEEASVSGLRLLARLRSFLPGNRAAQRHAGVRI
jgi:hypothetical protein